MKIKFFVSFILTKEDQILFALPGELKYDEEVNQIYFYTMIIYFNFQSNEIITRVDLEQDHQFGPFPAILKVCIVKIS